MTKYIAPSIYLKGFNCPYCGVLAEHSWYKLHASVLPETPTFYSANAIPAHNVDLLLNLSSNRSKLEAGSPFLVKDEAQPLKRPRVENISLSLCRHCQMIAIWQSDNLIHPRNSSELIPPADIPESAKRDYIEAAMIVDASPRGAAALLRLCIEKICQDQGCKGDLNAMISELVNKHGLSPRIQKALDTVRVIGGQAVHPLQMDLRDDKETALNLFRIVDIIVRQVISDRLQVDSLYESLPESKRSAIESRDIKSNQEAKAKNS